MQVVGNVKKMITSVNDQNIALYSLPVSQKTLYMNSLIGSDITVSFDGKINCIHCHRLIKKSFNQGYCFPCVKSLARCDSCIIKPELCHYSKGTCREPNWGEQNCLQDHFVYLANTGNIKVGITKFIRHKVSSRWIDQGAVQAIPIFRVKERLISGLVETLLKKYISDKTNWRNMLKDVRSNSDLFDIKNELFSNIKDEIQSIRDKYGIQSVHELSTQPVSITYPVLKYPEKIKTINLDNEKTFSGKLLGIKGQYLLFADDRVLNIRKYAGYNLEITIN